MKRFGQYSKALIIVCLTALVAGCTTDGPQKPQAGITFPLGIATPWQDTVVTKSFHTGEEITVQVKNNIGSVIAPTEFWKSWTVALSLTDTGPDSTPPTPPIPTLESKAQIDSDVDGVPDQADLCPGTAAGEPVDSYGCSINDRDKGPETIWGEGMFSSMSIKNGMQKMTVIFLGRTAVPHH